MLACLLEKGVDKDKALEKLDFDGSIAELRRLGVKVVKSGTLRALNKQRVIIKHYGQLAEPAAVADYFAIAREAVDGMLDDVVGKGLQDVMLHDLVRNDVTKSIVAKACKAIDAGDYFDALTEIRKALFVEIEEAYSIFDWREVDPRTLDILDACFEGGQKAPYDKKNKAWISENVYEPFDYVQFDREGLHRDLLEWGASTQEFWNLRRLTPPVFRFPGQHKWLVRKRLWTGKVREEDARYCLDKAISLILKKQDHFGLRRFPVDRSNPVVKIKRDTPIFAKACMDSLIVGHLKMGESYSIAAVLPGLDGNTEFARVEDLNRQRERKFIEGYVPLDACEVVE